MVICVSFHLAGSGLAKAGAIGRQLSTVHSRQRCPNQRRTREPPKVGCWSFSSTTPVDWIKASQALRKTASALLTAKQPLEKTPKTLGPRRLSGAYDKDGAIRMIQNAAHQIAHDVMANYASRL